MRRVLAAALVVAALGLGAHAELAETTPATTELKKRVSKLERQVRALKRLYLINARDIDRLGLKTRRVSTSLPLVRQAWRVGETTCFEDEEAVGGGVEFEGTSAETDSQVVMSIPISGGWYAQVFTRSSQPASVWAVCVKVDR